MLEHLKKDINTFHKSTDSLSFSKRLDAIFEHPQAMAVARSLPVVDALVLFSEVDPEEGLSLLQLLDFQQIQGFLDLDAWQKDELDVEKVGLWLERLFEADQLRAIQHMHRLDGETLTYLLKEVATVHELVEDQEWPEVTDLYSESPDRRYLTCFSSKPEHRKLAQAFHRFLESLYQRDIAFAWRLLESARWELSTPLLEEAFQLRDKRLQELGFLPREEQQGLLSILDLKAELKKARAQELKNSTSDFLESPEKTLTRSSFFQADMAFVDALSLSPNRREAIEQGLIQTTINLHALFLGDFAKPESLKKTAKYVRSLFEIGVAFLSQGKVTESAPLLERTSARHVVQVGRSAIFQLVLLLKRYLRQQDQYLLDSSGQYLDSPLREVALGLLQKEPHYFRGLSDPHQDSYRLFASLDDLALTAKAISELSFRALMCGPQGLGFSSDQFDVRTKQEICHATLLATAAVHHWLGHKELLSPLCPEDFHQWFSQWSVNEEGKRRPPSDFEKAMLALALDKVQHLIPSPGLADMTEAQQRTAHFVRATLVALETEFARIADPIVELQYVKILWIRETLNGES